MVFPARDLVGQHLRSCVAFLPRQKQGHTDIYLPIDAQQKQMFDSIDGERTIGEIARRHGDPDTARALRAALVVRPGRFRRSAAPRQGGLWP
jgi:hypothetical protein